MHALLLTYLSLPLTQVSSVTDVSMPSLAHIGGEAVGGRSRQLLLHLTDGKATCKAVEHKR